jgi:hypothetical protein
MIQINYTAVVELIALENATIKYSTVQNWYSGNEFGKGGVYNFVTKRGCVQDQIPKYHGLKLKRDQLLLGNIQVVYLSVIILKVSFIQ